MTPAVHRRKAGAVLAQLDRRPLCTSVYIAKPPYFNDYSSLGAVNDSSVLANYFKVTGLYDYITTMGGTCKYSIGKRRRVSTDRLECGGGRGGR